MKKKLKLRGTLLWVIGVILLVSLTVYCSLNQNHSMIGKLKKMVFPSSSGLPQKWILESRKTYIMCGHTQSKQTEYHLADPLKKVSKAHFKRIRKVNEHLYLYSENISDFCESCKKNQFLGLDDQQIVVFRGTPIRPGPVIERITINVGKLPEAEVEDLKKGVPFRNGKEKLQLLEGLNSLTTE